MARNLETNAGRLFASTLRVDALRSIHSWAEGARDAIDAEADREGCTLKAGHRNDAAAFGELAEAIKPFLSFLTAKDTGK